MLTLICVYRRYIYYRKLSFFSKKVDNMYLYLSFYTKNEKCFPKTIFPYDVSIFNIYKMFPIFRWARFLDFSSRIFTCRFHQVLFCFQQSTIFLSQTLSRKPFKLFKLLAKNNCYFYFTFKHVFVIRVFIVNLQVFLKKGIKGLK